MTYIKNKNKKNKINWFLAFILAISVIFANFFIFDQKIAAQDVSELNQKIGNKKKDIETLQKEIEAYEEQIEIKRKEAVSLKNQLSLLENQIAKLELDIKLTEDRIQEINFEIQKTNLEIKETEQKIESQKQRVTEVLRTIYFNDQISYLEILVLNNSFSDFFDEVHHLSQIHNSLKEALDKLKELKKDLELKKSTLEENKTKEENLKNKLEQQRQDLAERLNAKGILFIQAKLTEKQYRNYLYQLQLEQQQINADIITLEKRVREELEKRKKEERFQGLETAQLSWPIDPSRGITAYFHDPDYPFRYIFEHPAIDIRAAQGLSIGAAETGYVARVKFNGDTSYAYIMIIHNSGLSTVYGHVSRVDVKEDQFVAQGQTIGAVGGLPGTVGAGKLTTGSHLHFEVRLNGIPVNPLEYLPGF